MSSSMQWYALNVMASHENTIKESIQRQLHKNNLEEYVEEIFVPSQSISKIRRGQKITLESKMYPGYIFIKMAMNEHVVDIIKEIRYVAKFLGPDGIPTTISDEEIQNMKNLVEESESAATKINSNHYEVGELLKVMNGPFEGLFAMVESVDEQKLQLSVLVSILGRETPITLDFQHVSKI